MGNAAAKQLDETELGVGGLAQADKRSIVSTLVTNDGTTKIKNKGKKWIKYDGTVLWSYMNVGMFKKHSVIFDSTQKPVAVIIIEKKSIASCTNFICRSVPSYDGQEPLNEEELKKAGVKDTGGESLYKFAKIESSRKMTTSKCTYGLVTGVDSIEPLYEGDNQSMMGIRAIFKETSGTVVAKAYMPGMSMTPHVDTGSGVDMLAIVSMGYALAGDESSAGALAGAGVV